MFCETLIGTKTNMYLARGQFCEGFKAFFEEFFFALENEIVIRFQRGGVKSAHKNGLGLIIGMGDYPERSLAKHGPQAATEHQCLDFLGVLWDVENRRCIFFLCFYDHSFQAAFLTSDDGFHPTADRRGETDALIILVHKQSVTCSNGIAFSYAETGYNAYKISGFHGISVDSQGIGNPLFSSTSNGNVESFPYGNDICHD